MCSDILLTFNFVGFLNGVTLVNQMAINTIVISYFESFFSLP